MSQIEIDRVLAQIRTLSAQARPTAPANQAGQAGEAARSGGVSEFANILRAGIDQVNTTQQRAGALADAFERGAAGVELPQVMLEVQKASVSFHALTEVRNRLISAYQDIMNIPL
jgi:flagellar hook-basal body complex protein FliE